MPWTDGHLDLAYLAIGGRDLAEPARAPETVSLPSLREADVTLAFATIFTAPGDTGPGGYPSFDDLDAAEQAGLEQISLYHALEDSGALTIVRSRADLERPRETLAVVLLMEGADPIRDPDDVARWHGFGVRMVGLSWRQGTRYAGGDAVGGPLTPRGGALVDALDAHGIVHDVSHLSETAFDDLLTRARGPVVATHSNCRALAGNSDRNLTDRQIRALADRDGIVGLNLYTRFLADGHRATCLDAIAHVQHIADCMGHRRGVGLGSDMDGGFDADDLPTDVDHPTRLGALSGGLRADGWSDEDVVGFEHGNWTRLLTRALPA